MDNQVIIFGCGMIGYEALNFLGSENICCFCDNDVQLAGTERYGKKIIPFKLLEQRYRNAIVIICAAERNSYDIAMQCEENAIFDYLFYAPVRKLCSEKAQFMAFLENPVSRMRARKDIHLAKIKELQRQVNYFRSHADIRSMKPAGNKLRRRQLNLVQVSAEFMEKIKVLEIKPFVYCGNLLGYVRHNGFIPWDDDIDFALIRDEYERLKDYCRQHIYTEKEFCNRNEVDQDKKINVDMEDYYWVDWEDHLQIVKHFSFGNIGLDFFSLDYYDENYAFDELINFVGKVREKWLTVISREERIDLIGNAFAKMKQNIVKKSNHIYFGIDNMEIWHKYHKGWIPREVVFPLKKALYEGVYFWIPNKPEEHAGYEYENIWDFPDDIGLQRHLVYDEKDE